MEARMRVGYFLEDRGHEILMKAFVSRVARENGLRSGEWFDDVRTRTGGGSIKAYRDFLRDFSRKNIPIPFDILIVASDGNCMGYSEKKKQLLGYAEKAIFPWLDILIFAIPDPHIERWYINDPQGFIKALGAGILPTAPPYKCKKGLYKKVMRDVIAGSNVPSQFGGYEYGERIVERMDLYEATQADNSLKHFIDDLSDALKRITSSK